LNVRTFSVADPAFEVAASIPIPGMSRTGIATRRRSLAAFIFLAFRKLVGLRYGLVTEVCHK
jgi:hypothetical protein